MKQGEVHLQLVQELKKTMVGDVQRLQDEVQHSYQILQPGRTAMVLGLLPGQATLRSTEGRQLRCWRDIK